MSIKEINVDELHNLGSNAYILDVRREEEFLEFRVPGAVNMPMDKILENPDSLANDKKYYVICKSGGRSMKVCQVLQSRGYDVINISGGSDSYRDKYDIKS